MNLFQKIFLSIFNLSKNIYFEFAVIALNIQKSAKKMSGTEKKLAVALFFVALILISYKSYSWYIAETKIAPAIGGEYSEVVTGEIRYINPILVQTDAEKALSHLLFSGLVRLDGDKIMPDIATNWEATDNGKKLVFYLRKDVVFSDGQPLTANDVVATVNLIKSPDMKSPLLSTWSEVEAVADNDYQVTFTLPREYGPFIYSCNFGVLPAHLSSDLFGKKFTGSGIYQFVKVKQKGKTITDVYLKRNPTYYANQSLVERIRFTYRSDASEAKKLFDGGKYTALSGALSDQGKNFSFPTSKRVGLVLNTRSDKLKDKAVRQKILENQKLDNPLQLTLTAPDSPLLKAKAEEIRDSLKDKNIEITLNLLNPVKFQDALNAKSHELLLYGFNFSYDRDPYLYWHTSQLEKNNFSGWANRNTDILLEDARMIIDGVERNKKYDQFFDAIKGEYMAYYYDPIDFNFVVRPELKNFIPVTGNEASSRYNYIDKWYLEEKRIKK